MYIGYYRTTVRRAKRLHSIVFTDDVRRCWYRIVFEPAAAHIIAQSLVELAGAHAESLLDGILDRQALVNLQSEICRKLWNQIVVVEIMHQHAGFGVEDGSVVATFVVSGRILPNLE